MGQIIYKKISLFDVEKGNILVHACNAQGIWGSGIAVEFKKRFPKSFIQYNAFCQIIPMDVGPVEGKVCLTPVENGYQIGCLITSSGFGNSLDSKKDILFNTRSAISELVSLDAVKNHPIIYSNKFNSGLFKVPWNETEAIINEFVKNDRLTWVICDPNLEEENETES